MLGAPGFVAPSDTLNVAMIGAGGMNPLDALRVATLHSADAIGLAKDIGSIVLGQDLQVSYLSADTAHENFSISESLILKIEAPDAICIIPGQSATAIKT